jgi:hypothetical protein
MVEERSFSLAGLLETRWNLAAQLTHPRMCASVCGSASGFFDFPAASAAHWIRDGKSKNPTMQSTLIMRCDN